MPTRVCCLLLYKRNAVHVMATMLTTSAVHRAQHYIALCGELARPNTTPLARGNRALCSACDVLCKECAVAQERLARVPVHSDVVVGKELNGVVMRALRVLSVEATRLCRESQISNCVVASCVSLLAGKASHASCSKRATSACQSVATHRIKLHLLVEGQLCRGRQIHGYRWLEPALRPYEIQ